MMPKGVWPQCLNLSCFQFPIPGACLSSFQTLSDHCLLTAFGPRTLLAGLNSLLRPQKTLCCPPDPNILVSFNYRDCSAPQTS